MKTATLVDCGIFIKRNHCIEGFNRNDSGETLGRNLVNYRFKHIHKINKKRSDFKLPPTDYIDLAAAQFPEISQKVIFLAKVESKFHRDRFANITSGPNHDRREVHKQTLLLYEVIYNEMIGI